MSRGLTPVSHKIQMDPTTGENRGFGFVLFASRADAEQALATMQGAVVGSRKIKLNWGKHEQKQRPALQQHPRQQQPQSQHQFWADGPAPAVVEGTAAAPLAGATRQVPSWLREELKRVQPKEGQEPGKAEQLQKGTPEVHVVASKRSRWEEEEEKDMNQKAEGLGEEGKRCGVRPSCLLAAGP